MSNSNILSLHGKVVLVTGAAQGIGLAVVKLAKEQGAQVILSDVNDEKGNAAAADIGALYVHLNVTDLDSIHNAVEQIINKYGRIDALVNNAGIAYVEEAISMTNGNFQRVLDIDLIGLFAVSRAVGKYMIQAKEGAIVNLASIAGHIAMFPTPIVAYATAEGGILAMTRSLAAEWAPFNIRVNSISPGTVNTELTKKAVDADTIKDMTSKVPMQRLIEPSEIAEAVLFMASSKASAITGQHLLVDGGVTIL